MIKDYFLLAFRNLTKRRMRSWLTMIGIFIGIAAVVSLVSLGHGLKEAITGQFASLGTDKLMIEAKGTGFGPPGSTVVEKLTTKDSEVIGRVHGVDLTADRLLQMSLIKYKDYQRYSMVVSLTQDESRKLILEVMEESMDLIPEYGRMLFKHDKYKVVVGSDYAAKKLFGKKLKLGDNINIEGQDFEIVGILKKTASIFGNDFVIMNEESMKEVFGIDDEVDLIIAKVINFKEIGAVSEKVEKALRKHRGVEKGKEDFSVQTPTQAVESLENVLDYTTWFLIFIAMISLLVGGIGIMNTMFTAVLERRKEIGIMKSIGARNRNILTLFLVESGILGLVGGIIGVILGMGLGKAVEVIATIVMGTQLIRANFTLTWIIVPLVFSFFVGSVSGVMPAIQAAKLKPVDALRK